MSDFLFYFELGDTERNIPILSIKHHLLKDLRIFTQYIYLK